MVTLPQVHVPLHICIYFHTWMLALIWSRHTFHILYPLPPFLKFYHGIKVTALPPLAIPPPTLSLISRSTTTPALLIKVSLLCLQPFHDVFSTCFVYKTRRGLFNIWSYKVSASHEGLTQIHDPRSRIVWSHDHVGPARTRLSLLSNEFLSTSQLDLHPSQQSCPVESSSTAELLGEVSSGHHWRTPRELRASRRHCHHQRRWIHVRI